VAASTSVGVTIWLVEVLPPGAGHDEPTVPSVTPGVRMTPAVSTPYQGQVMAASNCTKAAPSADVDPPTKNGSVATPPVRGVVARYADQKFTCS
jgi:hypothetical protein